MRGLRLSVCNSWFLFLRVVRDRLALRPAGIIGSVEAQACAGAPDDAYWERLARLEREALRGAFRASREMCATLRVRRPPCSPTFLPLCLTFSGFLADARCSEQEVLDQGIPLGTHEWLDVRGAQLLFGRLPVWSRLIVERPTEEEGGWPGYSIRDKVDDLRTCVPSRGARWASAGYLALVNLPNTRCCPQYRPRPPLGWLGVGNPRTAARHDLGRTRQSRGAASLLCTSASARL